MTARATGGAGGAGTISGAGGNAIATATGATTSLSNTIDATSNVSAIATGGSGSTTGTANASATANTANGQQATASSTASGSSDTGSTTATTLSSGLVTNVTATTSTSGGGTLTGESGANIGGSISSEFSSQFSASASAVGSPNSSVNSIISSNSNINAQLGSGNAHAVVFGAGTMSAFGASNATGTQTLTSSETFTLNATNLAGSLILGLASPITANVTGTFSITTKVGGTTIAAGTMTFATLAAANTFFTNDAINLGSFSHTNGLTVQVTETMVTSTPGAGFANELVLGATSERGPVITAPASAVIGVGKSGPLGAISLAEAGSAPTAAFSITLSDTHGDFSATASGTATVGGGGTTSLTIHGTLADINNTLATLKDTDASTSADTVTINATDVASSAAATPATIAVTVNGAPSISAPSSATVAQNVATAISGVSVSETGNTSGETFTVVVSDNAGVLSANTGATGGGGTITPSNSNKTLTIAGTLSQVDADLTTLKDDESSTSADTLSVSATDSFGNSATKSLPVTVTPASGHLAVAAPTAATIGVGRAGAIAGVSITELPTTAGETFTVTLSNGAGVLSATTAVSGGGGTITPSNGGKTLTIAGSLSQVNADLTTDDRGGSRRRDRRREHHGIADDGGRNVHGHAVERRGRAVGDDGRQRRRRTITPSNGGKTLTIAGSLSQVNADLTTLAETDATTASDVISVSASDSNGGSAGPATIAVTVNGAPSISAPSSATVAQNVATAISGVSVSETGNTSGEAFTVVVSDNAGVLSANTGATGGGGLRSR